MSPRFNLRFLLCLLLGSLALVSFTATLAGAWDGVVVRVIDGDTMLVAPKNAKRPEQAALSVRLYGIDAPELRQPGGPESKAALAGLALPGDLVDIIPVEADRYDRTVGLVIKDGLLLNLEQIKSGHARVYEKYCRASFCAAWKKAERQ